MWVGVSDVSAAFIFSKLQGGAGQNGSPEGLRLSTNTHCDTSHKKLMLQYSKRTIGKFVFGGWRGLVTRNW